MTIHFHLLKLPFIITIEKGGHARQIDQLLDTVAWYGLRFREEGERARATLRRWARGAV